jgi:hypothetical protein
MMESMPWRPATFFLATSLWAAAQPRITVNELVTIVRSAIGSGERDGQLAKKLHQLKLIESLDDHAIEELESEGAAVKSVAQLARLRETSQGLPKPAVAPVFEHPAPPLAEERRNVLAAAGIAALSYAKSLPDFICTQTVHRYQDSRGTWGLKDTLQIKLAYFERKEDYKLLSVNGRPTTKSYLTVGGAISQGEFGSLLLAIFDSASNTRFQWDHWTTIRKRPAYVFLFRILPAHSSFHVYFREGDTGPIHSVISGEHGYVYIDQETNSVVRIIAAADGLPRDFPIFASATMLDYGFSDVGGQSFLLPLHAEVRMESAALKTKNEVEFQSYRKFSSKTTISFDHQ